MDIRLLRSSAVIAICAVALPFLRTAAQELSSPRDVLWTIVHEACVPHELYRHDPKPCVRVDLRGGDEKGFAILKDIRGDTQFLLIPTVRISGIENPITWEPGAPNYFADAWEARAYVEETIHQSLPRNYIGLAINSASSRSQDQLHIHVDCVRLDVDEALRKNETSIKDRWSPLNTCFSGHCYVAIWAPGENLGSNNPFRLLAEELPGALDDMGNWTLVVVGASRANGALGFIILADQVNRKNQDLANGEELLDHACRIARTAPSNN